MAKLVLLVLAEHADTAGQCYPAVSLIAEEAEAGETAVKTALGSLAAEGLIVRERRYRENGADKSTLYTLQMSAPKTVPRSSPSSGTGPKMPRGGGRETTPTGGRDATGGGGRETTREGSGDDGERGRETTPQLEVLRTSNLNQPVEPATEPPRTRGFQRAAAISSTARLVDTHRLVKAWRDSHGDKPYTDGTYERITTKVDEMLRASQSPEVVARALRLWDARDDAGPGLLPYLYDQALKADRPASPAAVGPVLSTADKRVAAAQAAKAELLAEEQNIGTVIHLPGAAS